MQHKQEFHQQKRRPSGEAPRIYIKERGLPVMYNLRRNLVCTGVFTFAKMSVSFVVCLLGTIYQARISGSSLFPTPKALTQEKIICESRACKERAQVILSSIDQSADPCEDFYDYTCGNTSRKYVGAWGSSSRFDELSRVTFRKIYEFVRDYRQITESNNLIEALVLAYRICEKSELTLGQEVEATRKVLESEGFTAWPLLKKENAQKRFKSLEEILLTIGIDLMFPWKVLPNPGRKTPYTLQLRHWKSSWNVSKSDSGSEESMPVAGNGLAAKLYAALDATVLLFKPNASEEEIKFLFNKVMDFLHNYPQSETSSEVVGRTIKEVESEIPGFPLLELLNGRLKRYDVTLHEDSHILIKDLPNLLATIKYLQTKEPDDIFNFVWINRAYEMMMVSSIAYSHLKPIEELTMLIKPNLEARHVLCYKFALGAMPEVITKIYVETFFDHSIKPVARHLLNHIGKTYYERLSHIPWMDHQTWKNASNKLWNMLPNVAYSDSVMNDSLLDLRYKNVKMIRRNDAFISIFKAVLNKIESYGLPLLRNDSSNIRPEYQYENVNSAYSPEENSFGVYAGILQGVLFNKDLPMFMNLGAIGFVMAHEISHGFTNSGRKYDEEGRLVNWWSNYTLEVFKEKADCFVKQYSSIRDPLTNKTLNGERTLDENIADNAAVRVAFATLRHMLQDEPGVTLPGLEKFTTEQLFFISLALPWCGVVTASSMLKQIETDGHAPNRYRINWSLKNSEDFSAAFNCKRGSAMRLPDHERCVIW